MTTSNNPNPNELLREMRSLQGYPYMASLFADLDASCLAGNLPDEWWDKENRAVGQRMIGELEAMVERLEDTVCDLSEVEAELETQRDEAVALLGRLLAEVRALGAFQEDVRQAIGHTNWGVLEHHATAAESLLAKIKEAGDE